MNYGGFTPKIMGCMGSAGAWRALRRAGWNIGRDQTARLMRQADLNGAVTGRKPRTTQAVSAKARDSHPDLVQRRFKAEKPNRLWVADLTYVRTTSGFCYTAFSTDVFSRMSRVIICGRGVS